MRRVIFLKSFVLMTLISKSGSGTEASKRKVKGTLHWVSVQHAVDAEVSNSTTVYLAMKVQINTKSNPF